MEGNQMKEIKAHLDAAYAQLAGLTVGGEAKMPVGLAMAELASAMAEILEKEKGAPDGAQPLGGKAAPGLSGPMARPRRGGSGGERKSKGVERSFQIGRASCRERV